MVFSSVIFVFAFLPTVILLYYTVFRKNRKWQNNFLFISSIIFYSWGGVRYVFLLLGVILANWFFGYKIQTCAEKGKKAKAILTVSVIINISVLFIFKYFNFCVSNVELITKRTFNIAEIALPIGISFFTFQAMSYVIDVYREKVSSLKSPLDVGLYIAFFPQLIAGPIVRYETVADQIYNRKEDFDKFYDGVCRFSIGLGKKAVLANSLAIIARTAFGETDLSAGMAWLGIISYTLQIYFDFSGYSDMAIGLGKMFGFEFPENFNYPYISSSITEFWRRWHISMGTWFRDYVYFPLGGSRVERKSRVYFNLLVVWLLTGLWHGANWTFVLWGLLHYAVICIEKILGHKGNNVLCKIWRHFYTMIVVMVGWVFFNSDSVSYAFNYILSMFSCGSGIADPLFLTLLRENRLEIILSILFCLPVCKNLLDKLKSRNNSIYLAVKAGVSLAVLSLAVVYMTKGSYNPFIYFNF